MNFWFELDGSLVGLACEVQWGSCYRGRSGEDWIGVFGWIGFD